jgi:hypothetical protein
LIESVAFDRTGRLLASAGDDGRVNLWEVPATGKPRHSWGFRGSNKALAVAFDPIAPILAVAGQDGTIRLWDVDDPARPAPLGAPIVGHDGKAVVALAFSPHGGLLASGGQDQQVGLWHVDAKSGIVSRPRLRYQTNTILALAFMPPRGDVLAAGDADGSTCLYDVESLRLIGGTDCLQGEYSSYPDNAGIRGITFAPNGSLLTAGQGSPIVAWSSILWSLDEGSADRLRSAACRLAGRNLTDDEWNNVFGNTPFAGRRHKTCPNLR